jgi:isopentenyldiphosphate isomerase
MESQGTKEDYKILLNQLIQVAPNDQYLGPVDKWKAHTNSYLREEGALPHRAFSIFLFNSKN